MADKKNKLSQQNTTPNLYAWSVFLLAAAFLFYQYLIYILPSIISDQLLKTYALSGAGLGFMVSIYFYSYAFMQVPATFLMERFGAQKATSLALLICALGVLLFSSASSLTLMVLGRFLIGLGSAFASLSYMKLISTWFPTSYFPMMASFFGIACMVGAGTSETPLAWIVAKLNWQAMLWICALLGLILSIIAYVLLRSKRAEDHTQTPKKDNNFKRAHFKKILSQPYQWSLILFTGFAAAPIWVFAGLWGTPFLIEAYHLSRFDAASSVSFAFFGFVVGGIVIDMLARRFESSLPIASLGTLLTLITLALIIYVPGLSYWTLTGLIFLFGIFAGSYLSSYALARNTEDLSLVSTSTVLLNMAIPITASIAEPMIGFILDLFPHAQNEGARSFSISAYQSGLSVLLAYLVIALIMCLLLRKPIKNKAH